jgi:hypothetical protein
MRLRTTVVKPEAESVMPVWFRVDAVCIELRFLIKAGSFSWVFLLGF